GTIEIGSAEERHAVENELKQKEEEMSGFLERLQKVLNDNVKHVRLSTRLVSSPVCLVGTEIDYSPQLERLLQKGKSGGAKQRRILEINPKHDIFVKMLERYPNNSQDEMLGEYAELLLGYG